MKIVSGGQTGVDRAALDVALEMVIPCGGWCPAGRLDEFGRIPDQYPVRELASAGPNERTLRNVIDSDGTVIFHPGELSGGTEYTVQCCMDRKRLHLIINGAVTSADAAGALIRDFVRTHSIEVLNIAGPRQSEWPGGYRYAFTALNRAFRTAEGQPGTGGFQSPG